MVRLGQILTLDNNERFVVANTTYYDNNLFCYLVELNNNDNTGIYLEKENILIPVIDESLRDELEIIFANNLDN